MPKKEKITPEALKRIEKSKDKKFIERAKKAVKKK